MELGPIDSSLNYAIGIMLGGGWVLVFWGIRSLFSGNIATRREIDEKNAELDYLKSANIELRSQNDRLLYEIGPLVTRTLDAIQRVADKRQEGSL